MRLVKHEDQVVAVLRDGVRVNLAMTKTAEAALKQVLALRRVTFETNTVTRRSQGQILQNLSDEDLTAVSIALAEHQQEQGW